MARKNEFVIPAIEAAKFLGVSRSTLLRWARAKVIPSQQRGLSKTSPYYFRRRDLRFHAQANKSESMELSTDGVRDCTESALDEDN